MNRMIPATLVAFALAAAPALAASGHAHESHATAVPQIQLDGGRKWATDEALRLHMAAIRDDLSGHRSAIRAGTLPAPKAKQLGVAIEQRVAAILTDCKLQPEADRNLHVIVAELVQAADALQGKSTESPSRGASRALHAVQLYPKYFDHPGWRPLA